MPTAVEVDGLTRRYSPTAGVSEVSFRAETSQVTALLGRNGAGKTTTVEVCCGLRSRDAGTVRVLGLDPATSRVQLAARMAAMPQAGGSGASGIYPSVKVREVVELFAAQYAEPLPTGPLLERLGLDQVAGTTWKRLSGGEQQRVSLALALVGRPELVFLDEPSAGLDIHARHTMWDLIRDLKTAGVTVVLTTHALDEAEQLADSVVILDAGRVIASGAPAELTKSAAVPQLHFAAPAGLDTATLTASLPAGASASADPAGGYLVGPRVDPDVIAAVTAWCAAQGVLADHLTTGTRSLESVFLDGGRQSMTALDLTPVGRAAPRSRALTAQAVMEVKLVLRNGEQLLLTVIIPTLLLIVFAKTSIADVPKPRVDFMVPGVLALAVMSTAFTGQAIGTGFERRYGVLRRLGTTPLGRGSLLVAKTIAVICVEVLQVGLLLLIGLALGWDANGNGFAVVGLLLLGTAAFSSLGLLMAGTLRAEATLAAANLVYLVLLVLGGVAFPLSDYGSGLRHVLELLPISALSGGLRATLDGSGIPLHDWVTLLVWAAAGSAATLRWFRWE